MPDIQREDGLKLDQELDRRRRHVDSSEYSG